MRRSSSWSNTIRLQRKTPNEGTARSVFAVWARFRLDPHLYFPTAPLLTCEAWETPSARNSIWQHVALSKQSEELQSRNLRFSKTTICRTWRILEGQTLRQTLDLFQINRAEELIFKSLKPKAKKKKIWRYWWECVSQRLLLTPTHKQNCTVQVLKVTLKAAYDLIWLCKRSHFNDILTWGGN